MNVNQAHDSLMPSYSSNHYSFDSAQNDPKRPNILNLEEQPYEAAQVESSVELPHIARNVHSRKGLSSQSFSHSKLVKIPESRLERHVEGKLFCGSPVERPA